MIDRRPIVGVMGSHEKSWDDLAAPIGRLIAEHDYHLLTGAGGGVMSTVAKAFTDVEDRAGVSIGMIPTLNYDGSLVPREQYPNPYIEVPVITPLADKAKGDTNPFSRNQVNVMTSQALIFLPGAHGTKNEVSLAIRYKKPMILFGPEDEFKSFPEQPTRVDNLDEVVEFLEQVTDKFRQTLDEGFQK